MIGGLPIHLATRQLHHWDQPHRALPQSTGAAPGLKRTAPPGLLFFLQRKHPNITFSSLLFFTAAFPSFLFPSSISSLLDFSLFFSIVHLFFFVFLILAYLSLLNLTPTLSSSHTLPHSGLFLWLWAVILVCLLSLQIPISPAFLPNRSRFPSVVIPGGTTVHQSGW